MNIKLLVLGLALALVLLTLTLFSTFLDGTARAETETLTWYVDGNCSVCGEGTLDSPFQNINQALDVAGEGDTILVAQGMYTESLYINFGVTLMGGYAAASPTWTRDINRHKTIVTSDDRTVPGDWNGDWLGSCSVIKDDSTYKMWYSGGNEVYGESIGYTDSPDGINWFSPLSDPLLGPGPLGTWDQAGVADPAVLATGSGFQMWYVGLDGFGGRAIGYASSTDGLTWQKHGGNPLLRPDYLDRSSFGFPTVVQDGPGDYKMWYAGSGKIWLATSPDGLQWTKHYTSVLTPGLPGAWDDDRVYAPQVIASAGGYEMWYTAEGTTTSGPGIGFAWSDDGLDWTKSPANPVLTGATDTWEEGQSGNAMVVKEGQTNYQMWYRGGASSGGAFGQAASSDGIIWTKHGGNPIVNPGEPTQWGSSVVYMGESGDGAVLDGLTITGGFAEYGGGIRLSGAEPVIRNCTVTGNTGWIRGGGIEIVGGAPLIENTVVSDNMAPGGLAGGIFVNQASPTISASLIIDNLAKDSGGGLTIWRYSQPTLIATTIANNAARRGGGIDVDSGSAVSVYDSRIDGNAAGQSAGVRVRSSTLAMTNTFVVKNYTVASGPGAMSFWRASGNLVNVTIADNSTSGGPGGIDFTTNQPDGSLVILNSILAFNGTDDLSCLGGTCSVTYSDVQEVVPGIGNISADPRFVDRANGDYHLKGISPVIDAGTGEGAPVADFEGDPRPTDAVDMGADEYTGCHMVIFLPIISR